MVRYSGECVEGYLPALISGRVLHVGEVRLVVRYPWGLLYPRIDNVTVTGLYLEPYLPGMAVRSDESVVIV